MSNATAKPVINAASTIADLVKELQVHVMEVKSILNEHTNQLNKLCDSTNPNSLEYQLTLTDIKHKLDVLMASGNTKTTKTVSSKKDTAAAGAEGSNVTKFYPNAELWGQEQYSADPEFAVNLFTADEISAAEKDPSVSKKKAARAKSDAVFSYLYVNTNEDTRNKITELFNNSGAAEPVHTEEAPVKPVATAKKVVAKGKGKTTTVDEPVVATNDTNDVSLFNDNVEVAAPVTAAPAATKAKGKGRAK